MKTLTFKIEIHTTKEKLWEKMLDPQSFKRWTSEFAEGSYFEGSWSKGSKIRFLTPDGDGMTSMIAENRPFSYLSIKHLGFVKKGVDDMDSDAVRSWAPAYENYILNETEGGTELRIEMDVAPEFEECMSASWPKALNKLKEICEEVESD